jgi:hypothetical protein
MNDKQKEIYNKVRVCRSGTFVTVDYNSKDTKETILFTEKVFECIAVVIKHEGRVCMAHISYLDFITDRQIEESLSKIKAFITQNNTKPLNDETSIRLFGGRVGDEFGDKVQKKIQDFVDKKPEPIVKVKYDTTNSKNKGFIGTSIIVDKDGTSVSKDHFTIIMRNDNYDNIKGSNDIKSTNWDEKYNKCDELKETYIILLEEPIINHKREVRHSELSYFLRNCLGDTKLKNLDLSNLSQTLAPKQLTEVATKYGSLTNIEEIINVINVNKAQR